MRHADRRRWASGAGPWFQNRPGLTVAVAVALFLGILGLRFAVESEQDPVTLLFCLPIALVAIAFGLRAGLLAGAAGVALVVVWAAAKDLDLSLLGWTTRVLPMLLLGGLVGDAVDHLRRSEDERRRLEAAAQRHRDAVEFHDSVIQRLSAAKWALEGGNSDRALGIVTETVHVAEGIVSDLLRDADMGPDGLRGARPPTPPGDLHSTGRGPEQTSS